MTTPVIRPARPEERRTALRLSLAAPPQDAAELEGQVNAFIEYTRALGLSCERQFVVEAGGRAVAGCTCIPWPGRTGMVLAGPGGPGEAPTTLVDLLEHTLRSSQNNDIRLFQTLIPPAHTTLAAAFGEAGFSNLAVLHYLERDIERSDARDPARPAGFSNAELAVETFDDYLIDDWRGAIAASYDGSLDCPELAGLRHIDDIIAGHRSAGHFSPHRWLLLRAGGRPAGTVMLCANPLRSALEIVYTGIIPTFRGRGLGLFLVRKALALAAIEGFKAVTLAVDERNHPALGIYRHAGFEFTTSRRAMIRPAAAPNL